MTDQEKAERNYIRDSASHLYSRCAPDSLAFFSMTNKATGEKVLLAVARGNAASVVKSLCKELAEVYGGEVVDGAPDAVAIQQPSA